MADQSLEDISVPSVGQLLKDARAARKMSLEVAAKNLCISKSHLANLENDQEGLICDVYTLGFLRAYAQLLGLNANALIQKFKDQTLPPSSPHLVFPAPLPERGMPNVRILSLSLLALASVIIGYEWLKKRNVAPIQQEESAFVEVPLQKNVKAAESSSQESTPPASQEASLQTDSGESGSSPQVVLLKATEEAWVEVKNEKGDVIVSRIFQPGDSHEFKNYQNLVLKTGNARGMQLVGGQKTLVFRGNQGEIKSEISLDPEKWATSSSGGM